MRLSYQIVSIKYLQIIKFIYLFLSDRFNSAKSLLRFNAEKNREKINELAVCFRWR